jgi:hypothetical protein
MVSERDRTEKGGMISLRVSLVAIQQRRWYPATLSPGFHAIHLQGLGPLELSANIALAQQVD